MPVKPMPIRGFCVASHITAHGFTGRPLAKSVIKNKKSKSKLNALKKLLIGFTIIVVVGLLTIFGFFSKYNYVTARLAISQNKLVKVTVNMHPTYASIEDTISKKYGFTDIYIEYYFFDRPIHYYGIKIFNNCMKEAFVKQFGIRKYLQYRNEVDSICDIYLAK